MRTLTIIAIASMTLWIANPASAQEQNEDSARSQQQTEKQEGKGKQRRGRRGKNGRSGQRPGGRQGATDRDPSQFVDKLMSRFDTNKDGAISESEAPERLQRRFETMDTNGDKSVSKEEFVAALSNMQQGRGQRDRGQRPGGKRGKDGAEKGKGADGRKGKRGEGRSRRGDMDFSKLIEKADRNSDGVISIDEAPERIKKGFDRIDADNSGTITADELKSAMANRKGKGGKGKSRGRNKADEGKNKGPQKPKRPPMAEEGA